MFSADWRVSDDTVMHLANAECLIANAHLQPTKPDIYRKLIAHYKLAMTDMNLRCPGKTTVNSISLLDENNPDTGYLIDFNPRGAGSGASMRSSCIGLRYSKPEQINDLIAFSVESGRMTHHHPVGYLGGTSAALLVSYAIQGVPIRQWGARCLKHLDLAFEYVKNSRHCSEENSLSWPSFVRLWAGYLKLRKIESGLEEAQFPSVYGPEERDVEYRRFAGNDWAGKCGIDSVLIAYDGLLGCGGDWRELCERAVLHGGDNDSTGCIAGSFYGAVYGFEGVCKGNYADLEYAQRISRCGEETYRIQYQ